MSTPSPAPLAPIVFDQALLGLELLAQQGDANAKIPTATALDGKFIGKSFIGNISSTDSGLHGDDDEATAIKLTLLLAGTNSTDDCKINRRQHHSLPCCRRPSIHSLHTPILEP